MTFYKNKGGSLQSHSDWRPMTPSWGLPCLYTELSYCCLLTNGVRWSICHFHLGYSLEGLMLKLKLQYFGHLMRRTDSLEEMLMLGRLKAGGEEDNKGWDGWMASPTRWTWVWVNSGSWWRTGKPGVLWSMKSQRVGHDWVTELNWFSWSVLAIRLQSMESPRVRYNWATEHTQSFPYFEYIYIYIYTYIYIYIYRLYQVLEIIRPKV